jgi:DNA ligase D-like protein (predicted ligase)
VSGELFSSDLHLYEPKWDGIRCLAFAAKPPRFLSRNGHDISACFPELAALGQRIRAREWVLDGELIVLDSSGKPSFDLARDRNLLQDSGRIRRSAEATPAVFIAFDLLYRAGEPLFDLTLAARRRLLEEILSPSDIVRLSPAVRNGGQAFHSAAVAAGLEGTVIKALSSPYLPGRRSKHWIKIRQVSAADCVIGGYTAGGHGFRSLLVGQYDDAELVYLGHVGTGFSAAQKEVIVQALERITAAQSPFPAVPPAAAKGATWVRPAVVCTVEYLTWTGEGLLRHPVFRGIRSDKAAAECILQEDHPRKVKR